eukprot:scaffold445_cov187-Pinguiococcus_pyrenoidosus.AAC.1
MSKLALPRASDHDDVSAAELAKEVISTTGVRLSPMETARLAMLVAPDGYGRVKREAFVTFCLRQPRRLKDLLKICRLQIFRDLCDAFVEVHAGRSVSSADLMEQIVKRRKLAQIRAERLRLIKDRTDRQRRSDLRHQNDGVDDAKNGDDGEDDYDDDDDENDSDDEDDSDTDPDDEEEDEDDRDGDGNEDDENEAGDALGDLSKPVEMRNADDEERNDVAMTTWTPGDPRGRALPEYTFDEMLEDTLVAIMDGYSLQDDMERNPHYCTRNSSLNVAVDAALDPHALMRPSDFREKIQEYFEVRNQDRLETYEYVTLAQLCGADDPSNNWCFNVERLLFGVVLNSVERLKLPIWEDGKDKDADAGFDADRDLQDDLERTREESELVKLCAMLREDLCAMAAELGHDYAKVLGAFASECLGREADVDANDVSVTRLAAVVAAYMDAVEVEFRELAPNALCIAQLVASIDVEDVDAVVLKAEHDSVLPEQLPIFLKCRDAKVRRRLKKIRALLDTQPRPRRDTSAPVYDRHRRAIEVLTADVKLASPHAGRFKEQQKPMVHFLVPPPTEALKRKKAVMITGDADADALAAATAAALGDVAAGEERRSVETFRDFDDVCEYLDSAPDASPRSRVLSAFTALDPHNKGTVAVGAVAIALRVLDVAFDATSEAGRRGIEFFKRAGEQRFDYGRFAAAAARAWKVRQLCGGTLLGH